MPGTQLKIARQLYCRWLKTPVTDAELAEAFRASALFDAHREDPEFGYRYLTGQAEAAGERMCQRATWHICSAKRLDQRHQLERPGSAPQGRQSGA